MEKVAVIQLDSNTLKLLLVDVEGSYFKIYDEVIETLKLGTDIKEEGMINIVNVTQTLKV